MLTTKVIFKEAGLDAKHYITDPTYCKNFANEVIDPAGRSYEAGTKTLSFPETGTSLVVDEDVLRLFGFQDCSFEATKVSGKYEYNIKIGQSPDLNIIIDNQKQFIEEEDSFKAMRKKTTS